MDWTYINVWKLTRVAATTSVVVMMAGDGSGREGTTVLGKGANSNRTSGARWVITLTLGKDFGQGRLHHDDAEVTG